MRESIQTDTPWVSRASRRSATNGSSALAWEMKIWAEDINGARGVGE